MEANTTSEARTATVTITFPGTKAPSIIVTIVQEPSTVGIAEWKAKKNVLYPNPASNYLYVNSDMLDGLLYIYDVNGKMLLTKQINDNKIDINDLQNGVYTIRMVSKTGIMIKKFVKL